MVSQLENLKNVGVQEVALSGFTPGEPFIVKLKRPSLISLAHKGEIPNQLLGSAATLFAEGATHMMSDGEKFTELSNTILLLAKVSLVEPTYEELEKAGIELTDSQLMDIYMYTQQGVRLLDGFRKESEVEQDSESFQDPKQETK